jgi:NADPH:quinone reductase-like Zn-dependent oxidoreductase
MPCHLGKVKAFGVNGMDILQREGKYSVPAGASKILGVEFSGTIAEVGKKVTQWKLNDEVLGLVGGVHTDSFLLPAGCST